MDDGSKEFAQRMIEYMKLTPVEVLKSLGYTPSEITQHTYLYIDDDGKLAGMEKMDVSSYSADEYMPIGYVRSWVGGVKEAKENLDTILTAGEATELYGLASATVRQAINRGNIPARKSGGTWLLRRSDAEELWGDHEPITDYGGMTQCPYCGSEGATQFQPGQWNCYSCGRQFTE